MPGVSTIAAFPTIDLSRLGAPSLVARLSWQQCFDQILADFRTRWPDFDALLPSDPVIKALEVAAYRETLLRAGIDDAGQGTMLAFARGTNLDQLGAFYGVARLKIAPATDTTPALHESDDDFRARLQLVPELLAGPGLTGGGYRAAALSIAPELIHFDKSRFSMAGKTAGEQLSRIDVADVSGFIVHVTRREEKILETYREAFRRHGSTMLRHPGIRNGRLAKNHAQLAAMLDAMRIVVRTLTDDQVAQAHAFILTMLEERQRAVESDHPHVELFWEKFDYIRSNEGLNPEKPIDHSKTPEVIAISLTHFEQRCADLRLTLPCTVLELKRLLKTSKRRKFVDVKPVNSRHEKTVNCWVFRNPDHPQTPTAR